MAKRVQIRLGDVFCAEIDGAFKCYFQYVAKDAALLGDAVIRVFDTHYPMDYEPVIDDIVKDKVAFYAHTLIRFGLIYDAWYKIGNSKRIDSTDLESLIFGVVNDSVCDFENRKVVFVNPLENWTIWKFNYELKIIGVLPKEFHDKVIPGSIYPYIEIVTRMKYGYYRYTDPMY